jgi:hypothetical protein
MKKIIFAFLLLLLLPVLSFSQQNITIGVYGGVIVPMGNFADGFQASPTVGAEGYYPLAMNIDLFADIAYNFLSLKNTPVTVSNESYYYIESSAGVRFNFTPTKQKLFIEAGLGGYTYGYKFTSGAYTYNSSVSYTGINGGFGVIVPFSPKFEFMGKAKFHYIFTTGNSSNYFGLTAGINYKL